MFPLDLILLSNLIRWITKKCYCTLFTSNVSPVDSTVNKYLNSSLLKDVYYTGTVTDIKGDIAYIDGRYTFSTSQISRDVSVGNIVTCVLNSYKEGLLSDLTVIDILDDQLETLDELPPINSKSHGVIVKRDIRMFTVSPGQLQFNLDEVTTKFIPEVGDLIEINIERKTDKQNAMTIFPQGYRVISGKVTSYEDGDGFINDTIYFQKHHCQPGYLPHEHDRVVLSVIRCQNGSSKYRALQVTPLVDRKFQNPPNSLLSAQSFITDITFHPNEIICVNLNESKVIAAELINNSNTKYILSKLKAYTAECIIELIEPTDVKLTLKPKSKTSFNFKVTAKYFGFSTINFDFVFEDIIFNCRLNLLVVNKANDFIMSQLHLSKTDSPVWKTLVKERNGFSESKCNYSRKVPVPGRNFAPRLKFYPFKMGGYEIPDQMKTILSGQERSRAVKSELENFYPCLQAGLMEENYRIFMHCLLYLEELAELNVVSKLELISGFDKKDDFLVLNIEDGTNLTILQPGDKVLARKPWQPDGDVYEGIIWRIHAMELHIKFSRSFHDDYVSRSEYILTFKVSRTQKRLKHQAVDDVVQHLGTYWLFPYKVNFMPPFIVQVFDESEERGPRSSYNPKTNTKWNRHGDGYGKTQKYTLESTIPLERRRVVKWYNSNLNEEQKCAVINCLRAESRPCPYIIFGPPGTGKSMTLVEVCLQIYNLIPESKILLAAPSNSAADQLSLNLIGSGFIQDMDFVRLGGFRYVGGGNIPEGLVKYVFCPELGIEPSNRNDEIPRINRYCISEKRLIISTLGSIGTLRTMGFPNGYFTHFIVDEAGQVLEPENLILTSLMSPNSQMILAGDPLQLGPIVISHWAKIYGFPRSFLHRLSDFKPYMFDKVGFPDTCGYNPKFITKLVRSYRALPKLLCLVSRLFYCDELIPMVDGSTSEEAALYSKVRELFLPNSQVPIMFHSVQGVEMIEEGTYSFYNNQEVFQICTYLSQLYRLGVHPFDIGIVTPYIAQVKKIIQFLDSLSHEVPKIGSVEEFQGQEKNVILLSTVRSSSILDFNISQMTFLYNPQRINVAISRAKAVLIIVGNSNTLTNDDVWRNIIQYTIDNKSYRS